MITEDITAWLLWDFMYDLALFTIKADWFCAEVILYPENHNYKQRRDYHLYFKS